MTGVLLFLCLAVVLAVVLAGEILKWQAVVAGKEEIAMPPSELHSARCNSEK